MKDEEQAKRSRSFSRTILQSNLLTKEMVSECLKALQDPSTPVEEIMQRKGYLTQEMITGVYLKMGIVKCPFCGKEDKTPKRVSPKIKCQQCSESFPIPNHYPFVRSNKENEEIEALCGKQLADYKIQYCLGVGGMGQVYRAIHIRLNRPIALKILPKRLSQQNFVERFLREARLAAQLVHPNLVQIYDVGEVEGLYYIAMEYIQGKSLSQKITECQQMEAMEALGIIKQCTEGLDALHERGIIHRDIKPDNILISDNGVVKLTDFGLAKEEHGDSLTQSGSIVGTPLYMSPEQCIGKKATPASDIYSLGITLYHLLQGRVPFSGTSALEILSKRVEQPSPALSNTIPPKIRQIYNKMVHEDPKKRYSSAKKLKQALENITSQDLKYSRPSKIKYIIGFLVFIVIVVLCFYRFI